MASEKKRERIGTAGAAFFLGAVAVAGQVVLLRETVGLVGGNELAYGLTLAVWLLASGVGSFSASGFRGRAPGGILWVFLLAPAAYVLTLYLVWGGRQWLGAHPGEIISVGRALPFMALATAPLPFLTGAGFVFLAGQATETAGRAYAGEAVGSAAGGLGLSFLLGTVLGPIATGTAIAVLAAAGTGVWAFAGARRKAPGYASAAALLAAGVTLAAFAPNLKENLWYERAFPGYSVLADGRSPYGTMVAVEREGQRTVFQNGLIVATYPDVRNAEETVHFIILEHPAPRRVALLGGGVSGALAEVAKYNTVEEITYVELDRALPFFATEHFGYNPFADPRVNFVNSDGRLWARKARAAGEKFDVIITAVPDPSTAAMNRFYTLDFFGDARGILADGGVFGFKTASAQNYYTAEEKEYLRSIYTTLREAFGETAAFPVDAVVFLGSKEAALKTDGRFFDIALAKRGITNQYYRGAKIYTDRTEPAAVVAEKVYNDGPYMPGGIEEPGDVSDTATVRTVVSTPGVASGVITADRRADLSAVFREQAKINRDLAPASYYFSITLWAAKIGGWEKTLLTAGRRIRLWHVIAGLAGVTCLWFILKRRTAAWTRRASVVAVAVQGAAEISLEILLILGFQSVFGSSYLEVALVVSAFMAGLAAGSWYWSTKRQKGEVNDRQHIVNVLGGTAVLAVATTPVIYAVGKWGLLLPDALVHFVFLCLAGFAGLAGGLQFPAAVGLMEKEGRPGRAGALYGADLAGSAAGAVVVTTFFVPILGFARTGLAVAALLAATMLIMSSTELKVTGEKNDTRRRRIRP